MKNFIKSKSCILLIAIIFIGCTKDDSNVPNPNTETLVVQTLFVGSIKMNTATVETAVYGVGVNNNAILSKGVCINTIGNPTISDNKYEDIISIKSSTQYTYNAFQVNGLNQGTTYYAKGYVSTKSGIIYGNEVIFTTEFIKNPPILDFSQPVVWSKYNVVLHVSVTRYDYLYDSNLTVDMGFCYSSTNKVPTKADMVVRATSNVKYIFGASIEKLKPNTTYYCRAFTGRFGDIDVFYSNVQTFTTAL